MTMEVTVLPSDGEFDKIVTSECEVKDGKRRKTVYPDGGWGWVVVLATLATNMVADGISFSLGLMLNEFVNVFGQSQGKTAWIGGLFTAVPLLSGPIVSAFVDRYGCRVSTMVGGVISGFGFIVAIFGNSVEYEYLTFGLIGGLGLGLCYITVVVSVCQWFEKKRALATGLGAAGSGFGTFIYAPMTQYWINEYGWRGATLLLAGTFFNLCICGALMRDPPHIIKHKKTRREVGKAAKALLEPSVCNGTAGSNVQSQYPQAGDICAMLKSGRPPEVILQLLVEGTRGGRSQSDATVRTSHSVIELPTHVQLEDILEDEVLSSLLSAPDLEKISMKLKSLDLKENGINNNSNGDMTLLLSPTIEAVAESTPVSDLTNHLKTFLDNQGYEQPVLSNYLRQIRDYKSTLVRRSSGLACEQFPGKKSSSCPDISIHSTKNKGAAPQDKKWYTAALNLVTSVCNFSYFLEFHFFLLSSGIILLYTFFVVPYFYVTPLMVDNGYTAEDGSLVLGYVGLVTAVGMVLFGVLGDLPWINVPKLYALSMVTCGVACMVTPLAVSNYILLNLSVWVFALTFASSYALNTVLVAMLIPIEKFGTAYGLLLLCQGIGNLVGPPIAGSLADSTGSWDISFYLAGSGIITCGLLIGIIPYTTNSVMIGNRKLENDNYPKD